ncbi:hypothetical protein SARC_13326 [Sphaeroforma arctica JP610]|uniref:Mitochondrial import inner membrane translocase subunit n=1 Tax=Sphaeroforma arctica JP610 TaxID=667725 RepID=A0A0L0FBI6_9EUKA|nr:hypothetical protein SARC_13326 [Sphaeroforma arctica JP610]KNC74117.1 hypothetical protein SARC_13326 [Sphaeroforma arctica JP610]|eukprot:XP_014148019.1 hypothetical protein SARC_13326 [Sphaeroforma arctica JP610]
MSQIDESTRRELDGFLQLEDQKARFHSMVHEFTDKCFDRCIGTPGNSLSSKESACLGNCVERFLDTTFFIVNRLEAIKQ